MADVVRNRNREHGGPRDVAVHRNLLSRVVGLVYSVDPGTVTEGATNAASTLAATPDVARPRRRRYLAVTQGQSGCRAIEVEAGRIDGRLYRYELDERRLNGRGRLGRPATGGSKDKKKGRQGKAPKTNMRHSTHSKAKPRRRVRVPSAKHGMRARTLSR